MPETVRKKKHQQHGRLLLRKGVSVAARRSGVGVAYRSVEQGAPLTPVPTWKLYENPSYKSRAVVAVGAVAPITGLMDREEDDEEENSEEDEEEKKTRVQREGIKEADPQDTAIESAPRVPFPSARKLAASLWGELQEDGQGDSHSTICDFSESSPRSHFQRRPSSLSTSESPDSVQHHHSSKAPNTNQQISRSAHPLPSLSPPLKAITLMPGINSRLQSSASNCQISSPGKDAREELGEVLNRYEHAHIASPCDYVKASNRSQGLERTQVDTSRVESPFSEELKRALSKVQQVEAAQISARKEVDGLLRRCADEILMLRTKEQEKIQAAVLSIAEQLDKERKAKRNVEMENRRLASSLAGANKAVLAAKEELEKERKARQLMEDVCDELAKEIGEDKTEAEELKRELAKVRVEIEEERKTLQVTEAWREERVQMKLSEAKLELEERCIALDKLTLELELFLKQGKAHRVDAFLDRGGETLRVAVKKLQGETSESAFFLKDARGSFSPGYDVVSSDNACSWKSSRGSNEDRSTMHMNGYNSNDIQQTMHSAEHGLKDCGWNIDRLAREEYHWLVSPNAHLDEHDKQWISCMQASRRGERGMKSYGSKTRGLNSLDDRGLGDSFNTFEHRSGAGSDGSRSGGACSSELESSNEEEANWSADFDNSNAHLRQRDIALQSASKVEEESGWRSSPKFSRKVTNRSSEVMNVERRHGAARVEQRHGAKGPTGAGRLPYDGETRPKSAFSKHHTRLSEDDNGFSSLTGYSPVYKGAHMPSPDLFTQKGTNWNEHSAWSGRKAIYDSVDWSKPYKKNSLQAKLLLEDRFHGGNFKLVH